MTEAASLRVRVKFRLHHAILIDHLGRAREQRRRYATANQRRPTARSRTTNHPAIMANADGRSVIARRFFDVTQSIIADQAGLSRCSEARLQLIRRFSAAAVMAEAKLAAGQDIDVAAHAQLSSTLVRLAHRIEINRIAKTVPTLQEYLQTKAAEKEAAE
jgi:hypothetical protein